MYRVTSLIRNRHPPYNHHRALGIGILQGPMVVRFLVSEVTLQGSSLQKQCVPLRTGVPRSKETTPPSDPTVGSCIGPHGGPRGGGQFFMSEVPQRADVLVSDPWFCFTSRVQGLGSMVEGVGFRIVVTADRQIRRPRRAAGPAGQFALRASD